MAYQTLSWEQCLEVARGDRAHAWRYDGCVRRWGYNRFHDGGGEWCDVALVMRDGLHAHVSVGLQDEGHNITYETRIEGKDSVSDLEAACIDKVQSLRAQLADAMPLYKKTVTG